MDTDDLKPWGRMVGESPKAYHAFVGHFIGLPLWKRTMADAFTDHLIRCKKQNPSKKVHASNVWNEWRFRFSWLERAAAYDAELVEKDRLLRLHEIEAMNDRHIALSTALQDTVIERLQALMMSDTKEAMTPVQMAHVLDKASLIERRARDVATSITKTEGAAAGVSLDLTKLSEAELALFEQLVAKTEPTKLPAKG